MFGLEREGDRGFRIADPLRLTLTVLGLALLALLFLYLVRGCERDWWVLTGIVLDIIGALGLAVLDIPRMATSWYPGQLEEFHRDLSGEGTPPLTSTRKTILRDVVFQDNQPPPDSEWRFEEDDDRGVGLRVNPSPGSDARPQFVPLEFIQQYLRNDINEEANQVRQTAALILGIGFLFQLLGQLSDSLILIRVIGTGLSLIGLSPISC